MPAARLKDFLDRKKVKYTTIRHSPAYTAQEIASSAHIKGRELAKTVIARIDGDLKMVVLPASHKIDLEALREATGSKKVELAQENEFRDRFPGCETGAMPPFGNLYDMEVLVASSLAEDETIAFNAGSHTELFQMSYGDYESLVEPKVVEISRR